MTETQSISKKQNTDHNPGRVLLSDLPLSIIHIILAFVPIKDAIRTCILSRQWRYIWTSLPHLDFTDYIESEDYDADEEFEECMENFITHALFHHKGPIHKFKMSVPFVCTSPDTEEWLLCLSRKGIKELILDMDYIAGCIGLDLDSSIYSCEMLTYLHLCRCELDPPPTTFKGFLFLRHLHLQGVDLSLEGINSLLANSPLLEKLEIIDQAGSSVCSELRISAPRLKYLYLVDVCAEICLYAPLLADMYVEVTDGDFTTKHEPQKNSICNFTNLMGSLTELEKLRGHIYFIKYLSIGMESCHHSLVFHRLKDIELNSVNFEDIKETSTVARLIIGAPNLRMLTITTDPATGDDDALEAMHVSFKDFGCSPNFTFEKLRVVKIDGVCSLPAKTAFIKILLESSPVLETMELNIYVGIPNEKEQNLIAELSAFSRASPNAKLLIKSPIGG